MLLKVKKTYFQNMLLYSTFVAGTLMISYEAISIASIKLTFLQVAMLPSQIYCAMKLLSFISWRYIHQTLLTGVV